MAWVKLDDGAARHKKFRKAGPEAFALWVAGLCFCNDHKTDGVIQKDDLDELLPAFQGKKAQKIAERLTSNQIKERGNPSWIDLGDHWKVHDFEKFQPTKDEIEAQQAYEREKKRRQRVGGRTSPRDPPGDYLGESPGGYRQDSRRDSLEESPSTSLGESRQESPGVSLGVSPPPVPTVPSRPIPTESALADSSRASESAWGAGFDALLSAYPPNAVQGEDEARRAWYELCREGSIYADGEAPKTDRSVAISVAVRRVPAYAASDRWQEDGGRWIPSLQKFLRWGVWKSDPPAPGSQAKRSRGGPKHGADAERVDLAAEILARRRAS
jgi:hypothetical protein